MEIQPDINGTGDGAQSFGEIPAALTVGGNGLTADDWQMLPPELQDKLGGWATARDANRVEQRDRLKGEIEQMRAQLSQLTSQQIQPPAQAEPQIPEGADPRWGRLSDADFDRGYSQALQAYEQKLRDPEAEGPDVSAADVAALHKESARRQTAKAIQGFQAQQDAASAAQARQAQAYNGIMELIGATRALDSSDPIHAAANSEMEALVGPGGDLDDPTLKLAAYKIAVKAQGGRGAVSPRHQAIEAIQPGANQPSQVEARARSLEARGNTQEAHQVRLRDFLSR